MCDKTIIFISDECPICKKLDKNDKDVTYLDINSPEAEKYGVDEVPTVFVNDKRCRLMEDSETEEIFINCPEKHL